MRQLADASFGIVGWCIHDRTCSLASSWAAGQICLGHAVLMIITIAMLPFPHSTPHCLIFTAIRQSPGVNGSINKTGRKWRI